MQGWPSRGARHRAEMPQMFVSLPPSFPPSLFLLSTLLAPACGGVFAEADLGCRGHSSGGHSHFWAVCRHLTMHPQYLPRSLPGVATALHPGQVCRPRAMGSIQGAPCKPQTGVKEASPPPSHSHKTHSISRESSAETQLWLLHTPSQTSVLPASDRVTVHGGRPSKWAQAETRDSPP